MTDQSSVKRVKVSANWPVAISCKGGRVQVIARPHLFSESESDQLLISITRKDGFKRPYNHVEKVDDYGRVIWKHGDGPNLGRRLLERSFKRLWPDISFCPKLGEAKKPPPSGGSQSEGQVHVVAGTTMEPLLYYFPKSGERATYTSSGSLCGTAEVSNTPAPPVEVRSNKRVGGRDTLRGSLSPTPPGKPGGLPGVSEDPPLKCPIKWVPWKSGRVTSHEAFLWNKILQWYKAAIGEHKDFFQSISVKDFDKEESYSVVRDEDTQIALFVILLESWLVAQFEHE